NIMLVDDGRKAVIMDFGISGVADESESDELKAVSAATGESASVDDTGGKEVDWDVTSAGMGTPKYMPPEQWTKRGYGPPSDIYSLGAIVFECLTGRPVFGAGSMYVLLNAHLNEAPPRLRSIDPSIPKDIDEAVDKALAKDPANRFRRAEDFAEAITGLSKFRRWIPFMIRAMALAVVLGLLTFGVIKIQRAITIEIMRPSVSRLAELIARGVDPAMLESIHTEEDMNRREFTEIRDYLRVQADSNPEVKYVYILRSVEPPANWEFVVDKDDPGADGGAPPGEEYNEDFPGMNVALSMGVRASDQDFVSDDWGLLLSGYAPIGSETGAGGYILGVDVDNSTLVWFQRVVIAGGVVSWISLVILFISVERRRQAKERLRRRVAADS
ncbi:MAG: hypothetical protein KC561_17940, partial [Myxococcales bacterium]|nr:hypothetical protein [Myxococcales bacterium]